jgi:predicted metal-dependent peptidase
MEEKKEFNLNDHVHRLLIQEPFFASISRTIEKIESKGVPTAGVRIDADTGYFELYYNPDFFVQLTDKQKTGVLIHEFYHLIFEHVTGRLPDELQGVMGRSTAMKDIPSDTRALFMLWNIATDLSINCLIGAEKLPEKCVFPGVDKFEHFPSDQNAEWYYAELKKKAEQEKQDSDGGKSLEDIAKEMIGGQFDEHGEWGEVDETAVAIAKERLKEVLKEAAKEASQNNSWGSVSSSTRKDILERITAKVNWRSVLRYFVKTCIRAEKRSTVRRINKRYPYIHPGKKVTRNPRIAISIDQSGSVSDSMLAAFFSELNSLSDICTFTVVPFDTQVAEDKVFEWKKGQKKTWQRVLYGGTCFDAPTKYVNKGKFDGHIILTDMCAPKPVPSKCQRMWMTDSHNARNPYFKTNERVIPIDH